MKLNKYKNNGITSDELNIHNNVSKSRKIQIFLSTDIELKKKNGKQKLLLENEYMPWH